MLNAFLNRTCACCGAGCAAWDTEIVSDLPPPLTVIVPVRDELLVFAVILTLTVALFEPDAGETVNHVDVPRLTVQLTLEVMLKFLV